MLSNIIRRLAVFGMSLVPLDIREESHQHTAALTAITRWLGIGSYLEWTEETRISWLTSELSSKRPLFRTRDLDSLGFDPVVVKVLKTYQMASQQRPASLGAYVISQCQTASDVLAVMLLQKQNGMIPENNNMMRVVPLFETLDDLNRAADVLDTLFRIPVYVGAVKGKQEVMVGYSDSAKDAGRIAACWARLFLRSVGSTPATLSRQLRGTLWPTILGGASPACPHHAITLVLLHWTASCLLSVETAPCNLPKSTAWPATPGPTSLR